MSPPTYVQRAVNESSPTFEALLTGMPSYTATFNATTDTSEPLRTVSVPVCSPVTVDENDTVAVPPDTELAVDALICDGLTLNPLPLTESDTAWVSPLPRTVKTDDLP